MRLAALLLACSCATVQPLTASGPAVDCTAEAPCQKTEGCWMPGDTAKVLAERAQAWQQCRAELAAQPTRLADWVIPLGIGLAVGAAGGAVGVAVLKK